MGDDNIIRVKFNVSSVADTRRFRQFIDDLRAMLRDEDRPYVMQEAVRLRRQEDIPSRWMDMELSTNQHTITLRLRTDNLYVVGFRNAAGTWFELQHNDGHASMIDGSRLLRVSESYTGSGNTLGLTENVQIGREAVEEAINELADYDGTAENDDELKVWLLRVIVRFVESIRLNQVADRSIMDDDSKIDWVLVTFIKSWSKLCKLLLAVANDVVQDPEVLTRRFQSYASIGVHNAFELAAALGMVLISNSSRKRQKRSVVDDNDDHAVAGVTLVEVVEVIVRNIDGEDPGDLYGVISIDDGSGSQKLFDRERSNIQSISPGQQAELTGPGRAVSGADGFAVSFDLMDRDKDLSPDDEVSKGVVVWNPLDATSDEYDVVTGRMVAGENGLAELRYAVMTDAAVATVEVRVIQSSEDVPDVYGTVTTATKLEDGTPVAIKLLATGGSEAVSVEKGAGVVPLLRDVVAVPLCSALQVTVDLWDKNRVLSDDHLADGTVTFAPRLSGEEVQEVSGDDGRVAVRVAWSTWFE